MAIADFRPTDSCGVPQQLANQNGPESDGYRSRPCIAKGKFAMTDRTLTADDISVIRERFHGWEQATASQLADVFGVSVQRISAIVHSNRPDSHVD